MRPAGLVALGLFLAGCLKQVPAGHTGAPDAWIGDRPGTPRICIASLDGAAPMRAEERTRWHRAVEALRVGDPMLAMADLAEAGDHPSVGAAQAVALLFLGDPTQAESVQEALVERYPDDPCLLQAAAIVAREAGDRETALARVGHALEVAPDDPNAALIQVILVAEADPGAAEDLATALVERAPDDVGGHLVRMLLQLDRGAYEEAIPDMEVCYAAGLPVLDVLVAAYRASGRPDDVLRLYARNGLAPMEGADAVAEAENAGVAYREWIGVAEGEDLEAVVRTSQGDLTCTLFPEQAPLAVASFTRLARGGQAWTHPQTGEASEAPLYAGTTFHRVVPEFMVQGGDPAGDGSGGPGYVFVDEFDAALSFDQPGRLAMANSGPGTNGSQFFVTEVPLPYLDGRHTIFGQCDEASLGVVKAIARVPTDGDDAPLDPVTIESIEVRSVKR